MQEMKEYQGIHLRWTLPQIKKGDLVRFFYWDSDYKNYKGFRGYLISTRYLSAKPLQNKSRDIVRGNVLYTFKMYGRMGGGVSIGRFYNHRMSNLDILPNPKRD